MSLFSLVKSVEERHDRVCQEIASLDNVDKTSQALTEKLKRLQTDIQGANAWSKDSNQAEQGLKVSADIRQCLLENSLWQP